MRWERIRSAAAFLLLPAPVDTLRAAMIGRDGKAAREVVDEGPASGAAADGGALEVSVVLPCLNEAETFAPASTKALTALRQLGLAAR